MLYYYGMKERGFAPLCQPIMGLIKRMDDYTGKFYDVLVYDRQLDDIEVRSYRLEHIANISNETNEI